MIDETPLRIGTRGSDLALWQARHVADMIRSRLQRRTEIVIVKTSGDRIQNVAFHKMEGKGFFTKELQLALLEGDVDLVVHSLKDLPTEEPDGLAMVAISGRTDPADLLLAPAGSLSASHSDPLGLVRNACVGTSSLRRASQVLSLRPDARLKALRGNVPTRIGKLRDGQYNAILVAAAGVRRLDLDLEGLEVVPLPPEVMLPAPGQGALAIEARKDGPEANQLARLHDESVARRVTAERRLLQLLGGGCHLPLGCLATENEDGALRLEAALGAVDEDITTAGVTRVGALAPDPETVARLCHQALLEAPPGVPTS